MAELAKTVLDDIIALRRRRIQEAQAQVSMQELEQAATERSERRDFARAISGGKLRVIAELKRASPSRGVLCGVYRPREIARGYETAGAAALSVLTERDFFSGSLEDLQAARGAVQLPVLRKDFVIDPYQVYESVAAGADALLLIVAALPDAELRNLLALSDRLGIAALVEVHTETELGRALAAGAQIVGVNNRDLRTLEVNLETSFRLRPKIPSRCLAVSESGIKTPADLRRLAEVKFDAVLIGERFMTEADPGKTLADLLRDFESAPSGERQ
jgi:indole-3-glycerol phosphate synthase